MDASSPPLIEVSNASLAYRLPHNRPGTLKEFAIRSLKRQVRFETLWALGGVTFTVARGEVFGVLGPNGAGKSTLLKVLARVLPPTGGRVVVRGAVAPLIELGAGFNHELTAFENIVLYGTILGRDPKTMSRRAASILEWAELDDYIDVPLRSFSSGMLARLGFAVATDGDADVLLVDEVLSVGDLSFRRRSDERIHGLIGQGSAVVIVTHDLGALASLAHRVMWLDRGRMKMLGAPDEVIASYRSTT